MFNGYALYRVKALRNFGTIMKGALGGWVESERRLVP
jgi:hypothetical protein